MQYSPERAVDEHDAPRVWTRRLRQIQRPLATILVKDACTYPDNRSHRDAKWPYVKESRMVDKNPWTFHARGQPAERKCIQDPPLPDVDFAAVAYYARSF